MGSVTEALPRFDFGPHLPAGAREFVPESEGPEAWARFHALRLAVHRDLYPEDVPDPDAVAEARMRRPEPFHEARHLVLERDGRVLSRLGVSAVEPGSPEYEGHRHHIWVRIEVAPDARRRGLGSAWLPAVAAYAESRGARLLTGDSDDESGQAFAAAVGAEVRFRGWENRLWLERVDWDLMRRWTAIDAGPLRIERYEPFVPEAIWEEYAAGYTEVSRDVPLEGLEMGDFILTPERMRLHGERLEAQRKTLHVLAAWDEQGLAGVTELIYAEHDPEALEQELTAVHRRARGRGLARLLKARLLLEVAELHPQVRFVRTYNASSNDAMWKINDAMGFVRHRLELGYQMEVAALKARLAR